LFTDVGLFANLDSLAAYNSVNSVLFRSGVGSPAIVLDAFDWTAFEGPYSHSHSCVVV